MIKVDVPISEEKIKTLSAGDMIEITGMIFTGRDAVLPKLVKGIENGDINIDLRGGVIFHTGVSPAGVGPTSSNKLDIENSIIPLSKAGIKLHLGKGKLKRETVLELNRQNAVYAVTPPVTALFESRIIKKEVLAFGEEGMEALHGILVKDFPAIIACAKGKSIY